MMPAYRLVGAASGREAFEHHSRPEAAPTQLAGALQIAGLRFHFAGQPTPLFSVESLTLEAGQMLGIRGASGAGKTTLLHCLAGIEPASAGSIRWGGSEITRLWAAPLTRWRQQQLGLVFQDFHLIEGLSVLDNVLLPASFTRWRAAPALRSRAAALLERVGLQAPTRRAELLSRGERQRVAVARALLFSPPVLLADEPTASLDPENRAVIGSLLCELAREQGATLVVVSHDTELLARLDRVLELREGTLTTPHQETLNKADKAIRAPAHASILQHERDFELATSTGTVRPEPVGG